MQKDVKFQLEEAVEIPNWSKDYPEHKFTVFKCCFLSTKPNSHELEISADVLKACADTILGNFLVAKLEFGDATTHKDSEIIYGYFPNEQEIEFVEDDDGILKAYAYAVVSKRYSKEFNGIFEFDNIRNSSVEMTVTTAEDDENKVLSFDLYGLTVLGKTVNGSCPDADIKMVRFSTDEAEAYFAKNDTVDILKKFVNERKQSMADKSYKVDKSKEAMSEKAWGDVDKTDLRNKIMEASNKAKLVKDVYMLVEDGWEDAPSEHLKYPVMCFEGDTLVYNRYGLASALAYAKQEDETAVINKIERIYKKLDIDDSEGKEEDVKMNEIEFSAVNIGELWSKLWTVMTDEQHWDYAISGIYEEDNQKFAILKDGDLNLYRLDFSLTEDGLTIAEEVVEVKQEFVETDNMKKFAEPENVADYRFAEDDGKPDEDKSDIDDDDKDEQEEDMAEKLAKLEKDIEERDNIIMEKDKELEELRQFKADVEEKEKAKSVEGIMAEVKEFLDDEAFKAYREEGMLCKMDEIDGWANKVKAASFEASKNKKSKKENTGIWGFAAPISNSNKKSDSVWDRI
nr:MAG TPA: hypothetical protein [Caudoviricetes sp.]